MYIVLNYSECKYVTAKATECTYIVHLAGKRPKRHEVGNPTGRTLSRQDIPQAVHPVSRRPKRQMHRGGRSHPKAGYPT
jgi:hypothetical protein